MIAAACLVVALAVLVVPATSRADAKAGERKAQLCLLCHRTANTRAPLSEMPLLEGQPARYLYEQTKAFKEKRRREPAMETNTANLSDRDMRDIAAYLASLRPVRGPYEIDTAKAAAGKVAAAEHGCTTCHPASLSPKGDVPRLAGQTPAYLRVQLESFTAGKRPHTGGPAIALGADVSEALAQYFASIDAP